MRLAWAVILLCLSASLNADSDVSSQEGSLNNYHGSDSVVNSNNNTEDRSTSNTYNGAGSSSEIPVASAIAPSYLSSGAETCLQGTGGSLQTGVLGVAKGSYKRDPDCSRRRDAKVLADLGMRVAAVSRMCESVHVWISMFSSGTPCPILRGNKLVVGKRAYLVMKTEPETYIPDYSERSEWYDKILQIGVNVNENDSDDAISISDRFRTSKPAR
jgi:hypothetical protein